MSVVERPENLSVRLPQTPHKTLRPFYVFEQDNPADCSEADHALILLNTEFTQIPLEKLWKNSSVHVCADGGANRLYDYFEDPSQREKYIPRFITGDGDSLRPYVRDYYISKGSKMITQLSQYSNDFMKAIKVVILYLDEHSRCAFESEIEEMDGLSKLLNAYELQEKKLSTHKNLVINVAGGIGGRFDQTISLIHQLFVLSQRFPWIDMLFFTSQDVIFLLLKGTTLVEYSSRSIFNTDKIPKCGLLPFGEKVTLTTEGLQYDVDNWISEISGNVSSSNGIVGIDKFIVKSDGRLVMNVEIKR